MFKKILAGLITAVLSLGVVALVAGPASAHHNTIWPEVTCATDGTYKVNWSVENSESNKTEVITASSLPGVVPPNTTFGFSEKKNFVQTVTEPQDITLSLTGFWDGNTSTNNDDVYNTTSFTLSKKSFPTGCLKVTPEATPQPSTCVPNVPNKYTDPTYTLKAVTGIKYTVDGVDKAAGVYTSTNGSTVTIIASVTDPKYKIDGTSSWTFTFTKPDAVCTVKVVPEEPKFDQQVCKGQDSPGEHKLARYFIPDTTGVIYSVKLGSADEVVKSTGWYDVPEDVTDVQIIARADEKKFYVMDGGSKTWTYKVDKAGNCRTEVTPINPDVVDSICVAATPGVVPPATYTLTYVPHVIYLVSTDNVNFTPVTITKDTQYPATLGTTLYVKAVADDTTKYQTKDWSYSHPFTDPGDCKQIITPIKPDPTSQYCDDSKQPRVVIDGTVTIFAADHVEYYLDGVLKAAGTYVVAPGDHVITIKYDADKYKLDPLSHTFPFDFTIEPGKCLPTHDLLTPAAVSTQIGCFSAGSYTLSNSISDAKAVIWTVNGSPVAQGKYTVATPGTVTITAAPNAPDYGFTPGVQTTWTVDFKKPAVCDVETLAMTGQSPTGLLIAADLLVVAGLAMFAMRAVRRGRSQTA